MKKIHYTLTFIAILAGNSLMAQQANIKELMTNETSKQAIFSHIINDPQLRNEFLNTMVSYGKASHDMEGEKSQIRIEPDYNRAEACMEMVNRMHQMMQDNPEMMKMMKEKHPEMMEQMKQQHQEMDMDKMKKKDSQGMQMDRKKDGKKKKMKGMSMNIPNSIMDNSYQRGLAEDRQERQAAKDENRWW